MPAKINVTSHIFPYTPGHGRTKLFQTLDGTETTLAPGPQNDSKITD